MVNQLGLYIHIPFCKSKCDYCDFYSLPDRENQMDSYQTALLTHIKESAPLAKGYTVDTIYFGGGTPSYYGEKRLKEILSTIKRRFDVPSHAEVTLEANPSTLDKKALVFLRRSGFNRISVGMQSAQNAELASIHRSHTFEQTQEFVGFARAAKLKNLSLDLIYGLPHQTMEHWISTVEAALALEPEHLSCYGLKVEEGTPLHTRLYNNDKIHPKDNCNANSHYTPHCSNDLPDEDLQADLYLWTVDRLAEAGFQQYEISNFAKPGFQSRHNLKYWLTRPYMGFGPGAHSDFGDRRYSFLRDLDGYIHGVMHNGTLIDQEELIPRRERGGEYLMLRLRTTHGIEEWEYRREFFMNFDPIASRLASYEDNGWAMRDNQRWRLTPKGFLLSNQLIGELLDRQEGATFHSTLHRMQQDDSET